MIKTKPIPMSFLTDNRFVYGTRVSQMLGIQFPPDVLKKRVMQVSKKDGKGKAAYYIDARDLYDRLDRVVGPTNWESNFPHIIDAGDRICVVAALRIGDAIRQGESEELKLMEKTDWKTKEVKVVTNDLVLLRAGPNALKRAGVGHNVGAYLYQFKDEDTWEDINDKGYFLNPNIDIKKLPHFAIPPGGITLVIRELSNLVGLEIPDDLSKANKTDITALGDVLKKYWGIETLKSEDGKEPKYSWDDTFNLAACIARVTDYLDAHPGLTLDKLVDSFGI